MTETYPSDADLNALSGTTDGEQDVLFVPIGESPYYTSFYKMLYRLLDVARRAGDLRVYKDGDLTFGVKGGKYVNGDSTINYAGATEQSLTNNQTNYIYLTSAGTLTKNTTGFPVPSVTPHIPLATIVTASGSYDHADITDYRGRGLWSVCGAAGRDVNALDWQESVKDRDLTAPPGSPSLGDRYIVAAGGSGDWSGLDGHIVEYNGTSWTDITPTEGALTLVEDEDILVGYNGSAWVDLGSLANIRDLTDGGNADSLHTHATAGIENNAVTAPKIADGAVLAAALGYADDAVVVVQHGANAVASGTNLIAAYTAAESLTPGGAALAADNRAAVIVPPGKYDLGSSSLVLDTDYIDIIGSGVARYIRKTAVVWVNNSIHSGDPMASSVNSITLTNGELLGPDTIITSTGTVVNVTCDSLLLCGLSIVGTSGSSEGIKIDTAGKCDEGRFVDIAVTLPNATDQAIGAGGTNKDIAAHFEHCFSGSKMLVAASGEISGDAVDCTGAAGSFAATTLSGRFMSCLGAGESFIGTLSGSFAECVGHDGSFEDDCSGTFIRCCGSVRAFAGAAGGATASGTFEWCYGDDNSFAGQSTGLASGVFRYCIGGDNAFGGAGGTASGEFWNSRAGASVFGGAGGTASGEFYLCIANQRSFGGHDDGTASGKFVDCEAGDRSFGGGGTASGTFYRCVGGASSFGGYYEACTPNALASGTFVDCIGGSCSFAGQNNSGTSAKMIRCRLTGSGSGVIYWQGLMVGCEIEVISDEGNGQPDAVYVTGAARLYNNILIATGAAKSVNAAGAQSVKMAGNIANAATGVNITNTLLATGSHDAAANVTDSNVTL